MLTRGLCTSIGWYSTFDRGSIAMTLRSQGMIVSSLFVAVALSGCTTTKGAASTGIFGGGKPPASAAFISALQGGIVSRTGTAAALVWRRRFGGVHWQARFDLLAALPSGPVRCRWACACEWRRHHPNLLPSQNEEADLLLAALPLLERQSCAVPQRGLGSEMGAHPPSNRLTSYSRNPREQKIFLCGEACPGRIFCADACTEVVFVTRDIFQLLLLTERTSMGLFPRTLGSDSARCPWHSNAGHPSPGTSEASETSRELLDRRRPAAGAAAGRGPCRPVLQSAALHTTTSARLYDPTLILMALSWSYIHT